MFPNVSVCSAMFHIVSVCFIISPDCSKTCRAVVSKSTRAKYAPTSVQKNAKGCEL